MLYMYLMVTTDQIPIIDKQKIKEYKHNTKESHQISREESKRTKEQRRTTKTIRKRRLGASVG